MARERPKRKRRRAAEPRRKGGLMVGMRSGFKKAAGSVVGGERSRARKSSWLSTAVSIALLIAAIAFLFYRWR